MALPSSSTVYALVRNVPAEVCQGCGETRFSLRTARQVLLAPRSGQAPNDVVLVPIYDIDP